MIEPTITLPALGTLIHGGYLHGVLLIDGTLYAEVTAPADEGYVEDLP